MKIITRATAIKNLKKHIGQDLRKLALKYGITTYETGKQNKGWKGLVLERLAGLKTNISKAPNGLTYELKSVAFHYIKNELSNPNELSTPDAPSQISEQHKNKVFSPVITKHIGFVKKCSKCGGQGKVKMRYMYMGWRKTTHTLSCNKCYVENRNKYFYSI